MNLKKFLILLVLFCKDIHSTNKIFCISIPKSGTWMLDKCINKLTNKKVATERLAQLGILRHVYTDETSIALISPSLKILNQCINTIHNDEYLISHLLYKKDYENMLIKNNFKILFIIRDPRDQLVSLVYHIYKHPTMYSGLQKLKFNDLLTACIGNESANPHTSYFNNVTTNYNNFLPWRKSPICQTIRFENLVGPLGNGSLKLQVDEIKKIVKHLSLKTPSSTIAKTAKTLFGGTGTFRQGKIGSWKKYFTPEHKEQFKKVAGQLLIDLGYEKNLNW